MPKPITRNILLNPGPATTTDTVKSSLMVPDICPREEEFGDLIERVSKGLVKIVNGEKTHEAVIFTSSGTGAIEACLSSVLNNESKILIINNGAYGDRMAKISAHYYGDQVINFKSSWTQSPDLGQIEELLIKHPEISHLAVVHHETTTGMLNPIKQIKQISHKYNVDIIIDAMSSYAGLEIDLELDSYDYLISSSNKCIQGMAGLAFVICDREKLLLLEKVKSKSFYFDLFKQWKNFQKNKQMRFTPAVQVFYSLERAIEEFFGEGPNSRYRRYEKNWEVLIDGLKDLQLETLIPIKLQSKLLTTIIEPSHPSYSFKKMHDYLLKKGFTIYPGKIEKTNTFRIANIGAINHFDISNFVSSLEDYLKELNPNQT